MKKGYYVKGVFVAEGSELDLELKRERKASSQTDPDKPSRTEMKAQSDALQLLGTQLLGLRSDLLVPLALPEALLQALAEYQRLSNFEAKRRHTQYVGKLMRKLSPEQIEAIRRLLPAKARGASK